MSGREKSRRGGGRGVRGARAPASAAPGPAAAARAQGRRPDGGGASFAVRRLRWRPRSGCRTTGRKRSTSRSRTCGRCCTARPAPAWPAPAWPAPAERAARRGAARGWAPSGARAAGPWRCGVAAVLGDFRAERRPHAHGQAHGWGARPGRDLVRETVRPPPSYSSPYHSPYCMGARGQVCAEQLCGRAPPAGPGSLPRLRAGERRLGRRDRRARPGLSGAGVGARAAARGAQRGQWRARGGGGGGALRGGTQNSTRRRARSRLTGHVSSFPPVLTGHVSSLPPVPENFPRAVTLHPAGTPNPNPHAHTRTHPAHTSRITRAAGAAPRRAARQGPPRGWLPAGAKTHAGASRSPSRGIVSVSSCEQTPKRASARCKHPHGRPRGVAATFEEMGASTPAPRGAPRGRVGARRADAGEARKRQAHPALAVQKPHHRPCRACAAPRRRATRPQPRAARARAGKAARAPAACRALRARGGGWVRAHGGPRTPLRAA